MSESDTVERLWVLLAEATPPRPGTPYPSIEAAGIARQRGIEARAALLAAVPALLGVAGAADTVARRRRHESRAEAFDALDAALRKLDEVSR